MYLRAPPPSSPLVPLSRGSQVISLRAKVGGGLGVKTSLFVAFVFLVLLLAAPACIAQSCATCQYFSVTCQGVTWNGGDCMHTSKLTDCNVGYGQCSDPVFQYKTCTPYPHQGQPCYNPNFLTNLPRDPELLARAYVPDCDGNFVRLPRGQRSSTQKTSTGSKDGRTL